MGAPYECSFVLSHCSVMQTEQAGTGSCRQRRWSMSKLVVLIELRSVFSRRFSPIISRLNFGLIKDLLIVSRCLHRADQTPFNY